MNLFVTDPCPVQCARALDDKRIGKLLMEANQMLSLAVKLGRPSRGLPKLICETTQVGPGRVCSGLAHKNHPVSIWVRQTRENFEWSAAHARALAAEFEFRFGREHGSACRTNFICQFADNLPSGDQQPFQNSARNSSLGIDFSYLLVPESYQQYLIARWAGDAREPKWTKRDRPSWAIPV